MWRRTARQLARLRPSRASRCQSACRPIRRSRRFIGGALKTASARLAGTVAGAAAITLAVILFSAPAGAADPAGNFTLSSTDIAPGKPISQNQVFSGFGCSGKNISPALSWSNAPTGTKSFALLVHDPDAPTASGWWHWIVYDIPADVTSLPAGAGDPKKNLMPSGVVQGRTDFGSRGYGGPCPPPGKPHHYYFRLFALSVPKLEIPEDASPALIGFTVNSKALAKAELMGTYGR